MTKDAVLEILRQTQGYVSGEKISTQLGVSRAAVNTAVKALRSAGYDIRSATNRGYCLLGSPDSLTARELAGYLSPQRMKTLVCLESVDSTNNHLRGLALAGAPEGQVVLANEQSSGRGRRGREFLSQKGRGIYLSMLFRPDSLPADTAEITAWAAVAVSSAIEAVYGVTPGIKWVNDLVLGRRKVCGILTEMSVESESGFVQYLLIGVGINVAQHPGDFPEELSGIASSLSMETGLDISRAKLAAEVIQRLDALRTLWPRNREDYLKAYQSRDITAGKEITVIRGNIRQDATALAISDRFGLEVRYRDGSRETLSSGEVSISGLYE